MAKQNLYELIAKTLNEKLKGKYFKWGGVEGWIRGIEFAKGENTEEDYVFYIPYTSKHPNDYTTIKNYEEAQEFGVDGHFTFTQKDEGKWWPMRCLEKFEIYDSEEEMQKTS